MKPTRKRVVIIGGGFAGLAAARRLADVDADVVVIDRRNHHLFQPLLYQVAMAGLAGPEIASPIRRLLRNQDNARVLMLRARRIDLEASRIELAEGHIDFDYLIVAAGARSFYFGKDAWRKHALGLKTLEDALVLRARILSAFERAELEQDEDERRAWLTFVVIGAGPTGVEMAGALAEIAQNTLTRNFRNFDPSHARVVMIEGLDRPLATMPEDLSAKARAQLEELGVETRFGRFVKNVDENGVDLEDEHFEARTVIWAAGVRGQKLAETLGVELDRAGRIPVGPDLAIPGHPHVFAVGDIARAEQGGQPLPGVAPVAIQQGRHAAENVAALIAGRPTRPFVYFDKGQMATIGRRRAVAVTGSGRSWPEARRQLKLSGFPAWLAWVFVHIMTLVGFRNRVAVFIDWLWAYFSYQRSARVILRSRQGPYPIDEDEITGDIVS